MSRDVPSGTGWPGTSPRVHPLLLLLCIAALAAATAAACDNPSSPSTGGRLEGAYDFTVIKSPSCKVFGMTTRRAYIEQLGIHLTVTTPAADMYAYRENCSDSECVTEFRGQDNPDGILFFARHDDVLVSNVGIYLASGQARGTYADGRIEAVFDGTVAVAATEHCVASDHVFRFVRR